MEKNEPMNMFIERKYLSLVMLSALEDKIRIPVRPCNILYFILILTNLLVFL